MLLVPLSLLYIAQPLLHENFQVVVIDQRVEKDFFSAVRRELTPDVVCVGISCLTGPQIQQIVETCEFIISLRGKNDVPIVLGGPHPTLLPEQTLACPLVDFVVIGPGEIPFLELASSLKEGKSTDGIANTGGKENGKISIRETSRARPDSCDIPYHLVAKYGRPWTVPVITSYGCPFHCAFCVEKVLYPDFYELPLEPVMDMIEKALRLEPQFINFFDDNFLLRSDRVVDILSRCRENNLAFQWVCTGRADVVLDLENQILRFLKQQGLFAIYLGIESGSPRILELINKGITPEKALALNIKLKNEGIIPHYSFMAGFPTETETDRVQTTSLMRRLKEENPRAVIWKINKYTPYPGTELYDLAIENGFRPPENFEEWKQAFFYSRDYGTPFDAQL